MNLDAPTILVCHILLTALAALAAAYYGLGQKTYDGFWHYTAGTAAVSAAFLLFLFRVVPGFAGASVAGANALFILAGTLRYDGTRRFLAGRAAPAALYALPALMFAWGAWFHFVRDSLGARTSVLGALAFPLALGAVRLHLAAARRSSRALHLLMAALFLAMGATLLAHGLYRLLLADPAKPTLSIPYLLLVVLFDLGTALGLMLLNAERLERELLATQRRLDAILADAESETRELRRLEGLLPLCPRCASVRDDAGYWRRLETYVEARTGARFSHGLCPDCLRRHYPEEAGTAGG